MIKGSILFVACTISIYSMCEQPALENRLYNAIVDDADLQKVIHLVKTFELEELNLEKRVVLYTNVLFKAQKKIEDKALSVGIRQSRWDMVEFVVGALLGTGGGILTITGFIDARRAINEAEVVQQKIQSERFMAGFTFLSGSFLAYQGWTCSAQESALNKSRIIVDYLTMHIAHTRALQKDLKNGH